MFTGIIEATGRIAPAASRGPGLRVRVACPAIASRLAQGDSVCVSGVCLTALRVTRDAFEADLAEETVRRTTLSRSPAGFLVNLELPTPKGAPLGGHVVQGHVDGVGRLVRVERPQGAADRRFIIELPAATEPWVVPQGAIAIEGISLTVAGIQGRECTVAVIPHTFRATNLHALSAGDLVNVEVDVMAKYRAKAQSRSSLTVADLIDAGF
jgi:riboflavin synthase